MISKLENILVDTNVDSVYNYDNFSLQGLLSKFFEKIEECIKVGNEGLDFLKWLKEEGLPIEVQKEIEKMYKDGRLATIINETIFQNLNEKINILEYKQINVKSYGAIGDGITDDTEAIIKAIENVGSPWNKKPTILFFPSGIYKITKPIVIDRYYVTIQGVGQDESIIKPVGNINGIEIRGTKNSQLYGININNICIDGTEQIGNGLDVKYSGLNLEFENIQIINCDGKGMYFRSSFDFVAYNINVRGTTDSGIHLDEKKVDEEPLGFEEMSYITFYRSTVVDCGKNRPLQEQWRITGCNNVYLNDCKANEGYVGILYDGDSWSCRIKNFYMDGLSGVDIYGNIARAFVIDNDGINDLTIEDVYTWNCPSVVEVKKAKSINLIGISRNKWNSEGLDQEMFIIGSDFSGRLNLDGKPYTIKNNRTIAEADYASSLMVHGQSGIEVVFKNVNGTFLQGTNKLEIGVPGDREILYATVSNISELQVEGNDGKQYVLEPNIRWTGGYFVFELFLPSQVGIWTTKDIHATVMLMVKSSKRPNY